MKAYAAKRWQKEIKLRSSHAIGFLLSLKTPHRPEFWGAMAL